MSTPEQRVQDEIKTALKAGEKDRLTTLRMLLAAIKNERIELGRDVDEKAFLAVVQRAVKQRKDAAEQYRKGGREELAANEEREIEILDAYLPAQADEDEIRAAIRELIAAEGLAGPQAMGQVMRAMIGRFGASADGATINRLAREALAG